MTRICHITPVHVLLDNRIFYKQCVSLRDAGYEVFLVAQHHRDEVLEGIRVIALRPTKLRLVRWTFTCLEAFLRARKTNAAVYHFHDPEFLPWALLLRLLGSQVVYDIHEDYVSSVRQKHYLPKISRVLLGMLTGFAETWMSSRFSRVIAERYYQERFPNAVKVLNYPRVADGSRCSRSTTRLLYTGNVHPYRGAMIHAQIPRLVPGTSVDFVGRCSPKVLQWLAQNNQGHWSELHFAKVGETVPYEFIKEQYREGEWLAGLAIFDPNEHLEKKELTKFFEYMQYGLPIIASNFVTWQRLVEDNECGICVDPTDEIAIAEAVRQLQCDEKLWRRMSQKGYQTVREKYSWASQEKALLQLYDELTAKADFA